MRYHILNLTCQRVSSSYRGSYVTCWRQWRHQITRSISQSSEVNEASQEEESTSDPNIAPREGKWLIREVQARRHRGKPSGIHRIQFKHAKDPIERRYSPTPRQFSIVCPDPELVTSSIDTSNTRKLEVIELVKRHRMHQGVWKDWAGPEQALVILVTPSFAKWLEDDNHFMPMVLKNLTHRHNYKQNSIVVISAVVDGLSPSPEDIPVAERIGPLEGISFLHGERRHILGNHDVWDPQSFTDSSTTPDKLSHLIIDQPLTNNVAVTLPLANTLFVNGRHSTLNAAHWQRGQGSDPYKKVRVEQKQYQHVKAFRPGVTAVPSMFVPAMAITPTRLITSGLGNIVRQIGVGESLEAGSRPASQELETKVPEYMEFCKATTSVGVWALVYRKELLSPRFGLTTTYLSQSVNSAWDKEREQSKFVGVQLANGAILCRVLSGGGGWGAKQGLLSLDPQVNYKSDKPNDAEEFWMPGGSMEEEETTALGALARPGDYIQFFTVNPNKYKDFKSEEHITLDMHYWDGCINEEPPNEDEDIASIAWVKSTVFGVVPSTIDKMPVATPSVLKLGQKLFFRQGHFGAVSETGLFLRSQHRKNPIQSHVDNGPTEFQDLETKIDIPHSYMYRKLMERADESILKTNRNIRFTKMNQKAQFTLRRISLDPLGVD